MLENGLTDKDVLCINFNSNLMIPAGTLINEKGSFFLKIRSLIENREDLLNIPTKSTTDANSKRYVQIRDLSR